MVKSRCDYAGKWVVRKDNQYLMGDRLIDHGVQQVFSEDIDRAHIYYDLDQAELSGYRCGGKTEKLLTAQAV